MKQLPFNFIYGNSFKCELRLSPLGRLCFHQPDPEPHAIKLWTWGCSIHSGFVNSDHNPWKIASVTNSQSSLQHSSKLEHAVPLPLAWLRSSYTKSIAVRTCAGVRFQIPCHASILVFVACLFSTMRQSKEKAHLSPRILALTSFIFQFCVFLIFCASSVQHFNCFKQEGNLWYLFHQTAWNGSDYCLKKVHVLI